MKQARLVALVNPPTSQYAANWSNSLTRDDWLRGSFYTDLGRLLERGCFDLVFLADALAIPEDAEGDVATTLRTGGKGAIYLDPIVGLSHIAAVTSRLGLGATVSTTFQPPFSIARSLLSLDQLSGGRVAWNIVTSTTDAEARNYGLSAIPDKGSRYDHADDVVQTVIDLWEGWDADALLLDGRETSSPILRECTASRSARATRCCRAGRSPSPAARRIAPCSCRPAHPLEGSNSRPAGRRSSSRRRGPPT
jgi:hypothetical protein